MGVGADDSVANEVLELERRRLSSAVEADTDTLRQLFDPRLVYGHSSGVRDDFASMMQKITDNVFEYKWVEASELQVILHGDAAIVTGVQNGEVMVGTQQLNIHNSTLSVWLRTDGAWRLAAFQTTPLR